MRLYLLMASVILVLTGFQSCEKKTKDHRGYEGDLIPLEEEVANIDNYKKATERLIKRYGNLYPNVQYDNLERRALQSYFADSLNLRFNEFSIQIEEGDTLVTFAAQSGRDYYMRGNGDWSTSRLV